MWKILLSLFLLQSTPAKPPTYSVPTYTANELTITGPITNATTMAFDFPTWSAKLDNDTKSVTVTDPKNALTCYSGSIYKSDGTVGGFTYTCIIK